MNLNNFIKSLKLKLSGEHLGKGKIKYRLTSNDFFSKIFKLSPKFIINCVMCGYPRSGTHWISNVVEKSTGLYAPDFSEIEYERVYGNRIPLIKIHARSKIVLKLKMFFYYPRIPFVAILFIRTETLEMR